MKLKSFRIWNFKSIIDSELCHLSDTDNVLVLAGQNEAGKSAVIEALNFFRNGATKDFERFHRRKEDHPRVECSFTFQPDELKTIEADTGSNQLVKLLSRLGAITFFRGSTDKDDYKRIRLSEDVLGSLVVNIKKRNGNQASIGGNAQDGNAEETPEAPVEDEPEGTAEQTTNEENAADQQTVGSVASAKQLEEYLVNKIRKFSFYNSFSDLLPGNVTIGELEKFPAVLDFQTVFNIDLRTIVNRDARGIRRAELTINTNASDDLNTYWTQKFEEDTKYNFQIKITRNDPIDSSVVDFFVDREDHDPLILEQKSNGFRWFSAFNLRLRALGVDEWTMKNIVLLIDEPGQGLHEKAQFDVKNVINELATKGAQIIYTTHYPNLIGTEGLEFSRIRLVTNNKMHGSLVETPSQFSARPGHGSIDALSPLITAMGINSIGAFVSSERKNVVVEGISDHFYFSAMRDFLKRDEKFCFVPACGVTNVPNLVSVLIGWGFNYKAVFDDDAKSGRTAYNLLKSKFYDGDDEFTHEHIFQLKGCDGVEDLFEAGENGDFQKHVFRGKVDERNKKLKNSELAKDKKELQARLFVEKIKAGKLSLSSHTKGSFSEVFDWLDSKFSP